jgi:hypothetical protein
VLVGLGIWLLGASGSPDNRAASIERVTNDAAAAHAAARPKTVAAAAGALTTLTTQDLQRGEMDQPAAQAILTHLQDVLTAYDHGHVSDALRHLAVLSTLIGQLSRHGDIKQAALPAVAADLANLRSALRRAGPPPTAPAHTTTAPAGSHPPPPKLATPTPATAKPPAPPPPKPAPKAPGPAKPPHH